MSFAIIAISVLLFVVVAYAIVQALIEPNDTPHA